ncbi:5-formyltetrahydrofolate cyclo-ligase [hydrothermal vent metagenome]|uniref:5-formyltetrahydrofolate cyclo-ligase n=1 Tax=hydrothermal vent metagenome TaxID=652676 RepID=A0A1W1ECE9_9ZZZZ
MEIMQNKIEKTEFRKNCLKRLRKVSKIGRYKKDKVVLKRLYEIIKNNDAKSVMLYLPLNSEINTYPLIKRLRKEKVKIYVPFMEGKSFRLVKYRYPLEKKHFGLKEPKDSKQHRIKKLDIAIVPIVGMDVTFRRVGFGKGMYDRFFEKEIKNINKIVFVARALCYSEEIITNHYDIQADMVVVP